MSNTTTLNETEFIGTTKTRFIEMDVTNYDDNAGGDGEAFGPTDAGLSRFLPGGVSVQVDPGTTSQANTQVNAVAQYDYDANAIRLYYGGTDGSGLSEVSSNSDEGAVVRIKAMGK